MEKEVCMRKYIKMVGGLGLLIFLITMVTACGHHVHTTQIGKCQECGEVQGKEVVDNIDAQLELAAYYANSGVEQIQKGNEMMSYDVVKAGIEKFTKVKEALQEACKLCGEYKELSELKTKLNEAADCTPTQIPSNDSKSFIELANEMSTFADALHEASVEGTKVDELFN